MKVRLYRERFSLICQYNFTQPRLNRHLPAFALSYLAFSYGDGQGAMRSSLRGIPRDEPCREILFGQTR